ncbi:protein TILLER ANGLE CONTROL 1-like [Bidens hawaiensis]|uniref:protein TILLER ANGLE CONTROL 1-like n=1 Tax=Bidens hawaiensis TaxID=980011 RepID=UPI00404A0283
MKIFGWVHHQFVHKGAKKDIDNYDKVALLENEGFAGACDGWKEGILTIGTLGHDLFQDLKPKEDTFVCNQVLFIDDNDDDEEMESPLVQKPSSNHGLDHQEDHVAKDDKYQEDEIVVKDATNIKKSGERTTLADLFRADSESDHLFKNDELVNDRMIKVSYHSSSSSNSISNKDDESIKSFLITKTKKKLGKDGLAQPFWKTKQLMRKMLRKKIHPDIGNQKKGSPSIVSQEIDLHATCNWLRTSDQIWLHVTSVIRV